MPLPHVPEFVQGRTRDMITKISSALLGAGYQNFIVGGSIRDYLMGIEAKDCDMTTDATPDQSASILKSVGMRIFNAESIGTTVVLDGKNQYEITTFRDCGKYEQKKYTKDILTDLSRRDFTINTIAHDLGSGTTIDPFGGTLDISRGILRTPGPPEFRFKEDYLRILRGIRFHAKFNFRIEDQTEAAMISHSHMIIPNTYAEVIRNEITKIFSLKNATIALQKMHSLGVLKNVIPELNQLLDSPLYRDTMEFLSSVVNSGGDWRQNFASVLRWLDLSTVQSILARFMFSKNDQVAVFSMVKNYKNVIASRM